MESDDEARFLEELGLLGLFIQTPIRRASRETRCRINDVGRKRPEAAVREQLRFAFLDLHGLDPIRLEIVLIRESGHAHLTHHQESLKLRGHVFSDTDSSFGPGNTSLIDGTFGPIRVDALDHRDAVNRLGGFALIQEMVLVNGLSAEIGSVDLTLLGEEASAVRGSLISRA